MLILQFLKKEFLPYLEEWKESVDKREGYTKAAKKRMLLSQETLEGIHFTSMSIILYGCACMNVHMVILLAHSFIELLPLILDIPGVNIFFSAKLNQDPLEKHFGQLRQRGATNDNPTVEEAMKSTQSIRVINGIWCDDITGNCRGRKSKFDYSSCSLNEPLPKRKRH